MKRTVDAIGARGAAAEADAIGLNAWLKLVFCYTFIHTTAWYSYRVSSDIIVTREHVQTRSFSVAKIAVLRLADEVGHLPKCDHVRQKITSQYVRSPSSLSPFNRQLKELVRSLESNLLVWKEIPFSGVNWQARMSLLFLIIFFLTMFVHIIRYRK